ncbi:MAG: thiamine-phosphate kinase [Candidatus Eisenbacteria bacterium]|nr:thiamine-phosphate kinase [Candidatus Eisenbacteria bacterium]
MSGNSERLGALGEFTVIERLRRYIEARSGAAHPGTVLGIGDDAALLRPRDGRELVVTTDVQIAGRHYLPRWMSPAEIGRRALEVNLSDIAAMGATPSFVLVSLGLPRNFRLDHLLGVYEGLLDGLDAVRADLEVDARIVGGNLASITGEEWFLDLTVLGEVERGGALRRDGARVGDRVFVTGTPGRSGAGLDLIRYLESRPDGGPASPATLTRFGLEHPWSGPLLDAYLRPRARLLAGRGLRSAGATAAIDLSDGLLGDLAHLVERSGHGIAIERDRLPGYADRSLQAAAAFLASGGAGGLPTAPNFSASGPPTAPNAAAHWILGASDDYELCFTAPPGLDLAAACAPLPVSEVGEVTQAPGLRIIGLTPDEEALLRAGGFDHFRV